MAVDRGKEFEANIDSHLEALQPEIDYLRLRDLVYQNPKTKQYYKGLKNPSDFIASSETTNKRYYIECKAINSNDLNFSKVSQMDDLLKHSKNKGVRAGILVWYIEHQRTFWVDVKYADALRNEGKASILYSYVDSYIKDNGNNPLNPIYEIPSVTQKINSVYDFKEFFNIL